MNDLSPRPTSGAGAGIISPSPRSRSGHRLMRFIFFAMMLARCRPLLAVPLNDSAFHALSADHAARVSHGWHATAFHLFDVECDAAIKCVGRDVAGFADMPPISVFSTSLPGKLSGSFSAHELSHICTGQYGPPRHGARGHAAYHTGSHDKGRYHLALQYAISLIISKKPMMRRPKCAYDALCAPGAVSMPHVFEREYYFQMPCFSHTGIIAWLTSALARRAGFSMGRRHTGAQYRAGNVVAARRRRLKRTAQMLNKRQLHDCQRLRDSHFAPSCAYTTLFHAAAMSI